VAKFNKDDIRKKYHYYAIRVGIYFTMLIIAMAPLQVHISAPKCFLEMLNVNPHGLL
jgi:hypothetical protein